MRTFRPSKCGPRDRGKGICRLAAVLGVALLMGWSDVYGVDRSPGEVESNEVTCSTASECFDRALRVIEREQRDAAPQWQEAIAHLDAILSRFPDSVWAQRAKVHLGLLYRETAPAQAIPLFQEARKAFPVLGDYVQLWMGEAYQHLPDVQRAAEAFEAVLQADPRTVLKAEAWFRAGEAWVHSGSCERGLALLQRAVDESPDADWAPRALLAIGKCGVELNRPRVARDALRAVWARHPLAPEADVAESVLQEMGQATPTPAEQFQRARSLHRAARFEAAIAAWQRYLAYGREQAKDWFKARFHLGLGYARLRRYEQAREVFQSLAASRSAMAGQATVWLGRVYLRQGEGAKLVALCRRADDRVHLSGDQRAMLWVFCGVWFQDHGRIEEALRAYRKAADVAATRSRRLDALWRIGWIQYRQGHYDRAISTFRTIMKRARQAREDSEHRLRAWYWLGRAKEQLGELDRAQESYRTLGQAFPYTYYGQLALGRLRPEEVRLIAARARDSLAYPANEKSSKVESDRQYHKIVSLARLRLFLAAIREVEALAKRYASQKDEWPALMRLAQQVQAYHLGIRLAVERFGSDLRQGRLPPSSPVWGAAFPRGYVSAIEPQTRDGVDPYLVLGIIREESLYDRYAVSRVGAIGLMQLMPETARRVARTLGMPLPSEHALFDPIVNVRLGSAYVAQLLERFQGNVVSAVAAYNAGPHVVQRWLARHDGRPADEFVESIAYRETRGYVKRVLGSYRIYHALNGGRCRTVSLDRIC